MTSQWRSMRSSLLLLLVSIGVFAAAFVARTMFLPDIVPIAWAEEAQSLWALEAAFLLRALENIAALSVVLVLAASVAQWAEQRTVKSRPAS